MLNQYKIFICFFIILQTAQLFPQSIISEKWYGGDYKDEGYEAVEMHDGGFLIIGTYNLSYYNDIYLIRTNSLGDTLWTKTYGGSSWDNGYTITATFDNNYILAAQLRVMHIL